MLHTTAQFVPIDTQRLTRSRFMTIYHVSADFLWYIRHLYAFAGPDTLRLAVDGTKVWSMDAVTKSWSTRVSNYNTQL